MLAAVRFDAALLRYASTELRADREVVLAAVKKGRNAVRCLNYAATNLLDDRAIILAAVQQDARCLRHASTELRADREVILAAVKKRGSYAVIHASEFAAAELLSAYVHWSTPNIYTYIYRGQGW